MLRIRRSLTRLVLPTLFLLLAATAPPLAAQQENEDNESRLRAPERLGVVFNTTSILLELDPYREAGIGIKARWERLALRGLLGFGFESGTERREFAIGSTLEYHLSPGRVSPYAGGGLLFAYFNQDTRPREITFGLEGVFGVEVMAHEILSFFAEYALAYRTTHVDSDTGSTRNHRFASGLGNKGSIGIVVYFLDRSPERHSPEDEAR